MQFLSPWMLSGLAALAVPIIIHLLQRKRVVPIPFSSLRLLKLVQAKTSRRSHVENLLLLILRCLIFALILLAAARPVISPKVAGTLGGNVPRTVVVMKVEEIYFQCGRALIRSGLWDPTKQIAAAEMRITLEQTKALFFQAISEARAATGSSRWT